MQELYDNTEEKGCYLEKKRFIYEFIRECDFKYSLKNNAIMEPYIDKNGHCNAIRARRYIWLGRGRMLAFTLYGEATDEKKIKYI